MNLPEPVARHPWAFGLGAAAIVVVLMMRGHKSTPTQTAVVSSSLDPTAAALDAQQMQVNAGLTAAQIQAQTQMAGLNALQTISLGNQAAQVQTAQIEANTVNTKTIASLYATAVGGLLSSDALAGNASAPSIGGAGSAYLNGVIGNGNMTLNPDQSRALGLDPRSHTHIPVYSQVGNPNSAPATNVTSNQISELFNNVIRFAQGSAPLQTVTMQNGSSAPSVVQTGTALVDPVFAVWDSSGAVPTITDITLNPDSQYGYTGSVFTPGNAKATNITPDAIRPKATPQATTLPKVTIPKWNWI